VAAAQLVEQWLMVGMEAILFLALLHLMVAVEVAAVLEPATLAIQAVLAVVVVDDQEQREVVMLDKGKLGVMLVVLLDLMRLVVVGVLVLVAVLEAVHLRTTLVMVAMEQLLLFQAHLFITQAVVVGVQKMSHQILALAV
jgi:hypothetical protein